MAGTEEKEGRPMDKITVTTPTGTVIQVQSDNVKSTGGSDRPDGGTAAQSQQDYFGIK